MSRKKKRVIAVLAAVTAIACIAGGLVIASIIFVITYKRKDRILNK